MARGRQEGVGAELISRWHAACSWAASLAPSHRCSTAGRGVAGTRCSTPQRSPGAACRGCVSAGAQCRRHLGCSPAEGSARWWWCMRVCVCVVGGWCVGGGHAAALWSSNPAAASRPQQQRAGPLEHPAPVTDGAVQAGLLAARCPPLRAACLHDFLPGAASGPGLHQPRQAKVHRDGAVHAPRRLQRRQPLPPLLQLQHRPRHRLAGGVGGPHAGPRHALGGHHCGRRRATQEGRGAVGAAAGEAAERRAASRGGSPTEGSRKLQEDGRTARRNPVAQRHLSAAPRPPP
jgi:hypothetical protein